MIIRFTARALAMPQICACCGNDATEYIPLPVRRGAYEIPYCARCRDHVNAHRTLWTHALGAAFGAAILAAIIVAIVDGHAFAVASTLFSVGATVWSFGTIHRAVATGHMRLNGCVALNDAVHLARDERAILAFRVENRNFAAHLLAANAGNLTDLDDESKQLMAWGASRAARVPRRITAA